jgi:hypothetical protein
MRLQTIDSNGQRVAFDADPNRVAIIDHFFKSNPGILGMGAGSPFGRSTAKDALEAQAFLTSQLTFLETNMYEAPYQKLLYEQLLGPTIKSTNAPWATSVTYEISDRAGKGRTSANGANDIPYADASVARIEKQIKRGTIGYRYSTEDLRISGYMGRPLDAKKLAAALEAFRSHMNDVALIGEAQSNFTGLFNNATVTPANRPSGAVWDAASADSIIADITALLAAVQTASVDLAATSVTKIALPVASLQRIIAVRLANTSMSVKQYIEQAYPGVEFIAVPALATLGVGPSKRMVGFTPIDDNMVMHITMDPTFQPPQPRALDFDVPGEYKFGGLEVRRPYTMYYMDAI